MPKDLTDSPVDRQNILNNPFAVAEIQKATQLRGVLFDGVARIVKEQIAAFFEVDSRTIERCLEQNADELSQNGYEVIRGKRLQDFRLAISAQDVTDINVGNKTPQVGIFDFRAFLNIGMLLTDSLQMENVSYHVAAGRIDKDLLRDIFDAVLNIEFDDNEELKLRLLRAISEPQ